MKTATQAMPKNNKVSFGELNTKSATKKVAGVVLRGLEKLVDAFTEAKSAYDVAEGRLETAKAELLDASLPEFWKKAGGESSATIQGNGKSAKIVIPNRYKVLDDEAAAHAQDAIGAKVFSKYWEQAWKLTIKSELIPSSKQQAFVDGLKKLAKDLDLPLSGDASPLVVSSGVQPNERFHEERKDLPLAVNLAVHQHGGGVAYVR